MANSGPSIEQIKAVTAKLLAYCRDNDWAGYDPYDVLNSRILGSLSADNSRLLRLAFTQLIKRSPINIRPLLLVPKTQNPKAIALFLMAILKLQKLGMIREESLAEIMVEKLRALRAKGTAHEGWGYSFPWQTRTKLVPRGTPNLVCTVFVANALLDVYEQSQDSRCLAMAIDASDLIYHDLYWTASDYSAGFGYPLPSARSPVHNANLLGAAFLCRVYKHTGEIKLLAPALKVARYSASKQNVDGSWFYGESASQRWIDNFHTGYNLMALRDIHKYCQTTEFNLHIQRGFDFYKKNFFTEDHIVKYFYDRVYPIDIHCIAQSLITLSAFKELDANNIDVAVAISGWAMSHMWDNHGYFYYQVLPVYKNKISYMRWSQAWMLLALSTLLQELSIVKDLHDKEVGQTMADFLPS